MSKHFTNKEAFGVKRFGKGSSNLMYNLITKYGLEGFSIQSSVSDTDDLETAFNWIPTSNEP